MQNVRKLVVNTCLYAGRARSRGNKYDTFLQYGDVVTDYFVCIYIYTNSITDVLKSIIISAKNVVTRA